MTTDEARAVWEAEVFKTLRLIIEGADRTDPKTVEHYRDLFIGGVEHVGDGNKIDTVVLAGLASAAVCYMRELYVAAFPDGPAEDRGLLPIAGP